MVEALSRDAFKPLDCKTLALLVLLLIHTAMSGLAVATSVKSSRVSWSSHQPSGLVVAPEIMSQKVKKKKVQIALLNHRHLWMFHSPYLPYLRLKNCLSLARRVSLSPYISWSLFPLSLSSLVSSEEC